jgi:nucleotide-binding universal stress UspA family protein
MPWVSPMAWHRHRGMLLSPGLEPEQYLEEDFVKTILIATDGSEAAREALTVAIDLARDTGATLQILSVRPPRMSGRAGAPVLEVEHFEGPQHVANAAAEHAREVGVNAIPHAAHGDVVTCIADAAVTLEADLLVVGSRGLGSLSGALLGSVSRALVHRSTVPVTVVRHGSVHAATES